MFFECYRLASLDLSSFNTAAVTDMSNMFTWCSALATIYVFDGWDVSNVTASASMFAGCSALVGGAGTAYSGANQTAGYAVIDGGTDAPGYLTQKPPTSFAVYSADDSAIVFYSDHVVPAVGDTYRERTVTAVDDSIEVLDGLWDAVKAASTATTLTMDTEIVFPGESMVGWLSNFPLTSVDLSKLDTSSVTDMRNLFLRCMGLTEVNLENWDTSNVTDMSFMFRSCSALTYVDLSHFDTSRVTTMNSMFYECSALTEVNLVGFDTSAVEDMGYMFQYCKKLRSLDLSTFDTWSVEKTTQMFYQCQILYAIFVSPDMWNLEQVKSNSSSNMFYSCAWLKGENGTSCSSSGVLDGEYARIDTEEAPGYLTNVANKDNITCPYPLPSSEVSETATAAAYAEKDGEEEGAAGNVGTTTCEVVEVAAEAESGATVVGDATGSVANVLAAAEAETLSFEEAAVATAAIPAGGLIALRARRRRAA
jgi:surface protein